MKKNRISFRIALKTLFFVIVFICQISLSSCGKNNDAEIPHGSVVVMNNQSVVAGSVSLEYVFYTTKEELSLWTEESIDSVAVYVNDKKYSAELDYVVTEEKAVWDYYYAGQLCVTVNDLNEGGSVVLEVAFNDQSIKTYDAGNVGVIQKQENDGRVHIDALGGVVAEDDDGMVWSYGIILKCYVYNTVTIRTIDFDIEELGLSLENAVVYTTEEYKKEILSAILNTNYDEYVADAYKRHYSENLNDTGTITLESGEYYLYLPILWKNEDGYQIAQGAVNVTYESEEGVYVETSGQFPFYSSTACSYKMLKELFGV